MTLEVYQHHSETCRCLELSSYLWFVTSLKNIQKLSAKSLQLREPDSGREEDEFRAAGQGHAAQNKKLRCSHTDQFRGGLRHQLGPVTRVKR